MYISGNFILDHLFFENQGKINIKKFNKFWCNSKVYQGPSTSSPIAMQVILFFHINIPVSFLPRLSKKLGR
jgi:hypothetical protein